MTSWKVHDNHENVFSKTRDYEKAVKEHEGHNTGWATPVWILRWLSISDDEHIKRRDEFHSCIICKGKPRYILLSSPFRLGSSEYKLAICKRCANDASNMMNNMWRMK